MRHYIFLFLFLLLCCLPAAREEDHPGYSHRDSLINLLNKQELATSEEVEILFQLGLFYNNIGSYDAARFYLEKAIDLPEGREFECGRILVNLANSYIFQGQYAQALKYYLEALAVGEEVVATGKSEIERRPGQWNVIRAMANISETYYLIGNQSRALYYAQQADKALEVTGNPEDRYIRPQVLYVIGSVYLDRGALDEAEAYMSKACLFADQLCRLYIELRGDPAGMHIYRAYGREGLARVYLARKDYARALDYADQGLVAARESNDPMVQAKAWSALSDIYREQGAYDASGRAALSALEINPDHISLDPGMAFNIAISNLFAGNKEKAYEFLRIYSSRMKEYTDKHFRETMSSMEIQFETEKKEMRIFNLERRQWYYLGLASSGILLALAAWTVYRLQMRRERTRKQLLAAHAVLEGERKERERFARDLHDGLGGMLSALKIELVNAGHSQNIRDHLDDCIGELRRIAIGVMPLSLHRFGMKAALEDYCHSFPHVCFRFFGEDRRIDEKMELVVYYCAYELVNNSVRHSGATVIHVQLIQDDDHVSLTVQDDGCGFDRESFAQGAGLKNLNDRVMAFNGKLDIASSPDNGTETVIELKI
ncbi:MAG: sensor histidine kinase [Tannerellaceae bacterium]|jgi:signal transduction histidine kinase/Tfp pilus assembly protein PilF|nr:sensor histidine kinase [Tannerellaceae bacterium]